MLFSLSTVIGRACWGSSSVSSFQRQKGKIHLVSFFLTACSVVKGYDCCDFLNFLSSNYELRADHRFYASETIFHGGVHWWSGGVHSMSAVVDVRSLIFGTVGDEKKTVRINGTQSTRPFGNLRLSADCESFNCSRIVFDCVAGFDAGLERLHFSFQPLETFFHELRDSCHRRDVRLDGGVEQDSTSCISLR